VASIAVAAADNAAVAAAVLISAGKFYNLSLSCALRVLTPTKLLL
jgi:hypothetical protein